MSAINGIGSSSPVQKIATSPVHKELPAQPAKQLKLTDRVELSGVSHLLAALKANGIRADKVSSVRAAIEAGKYETSEKLDAAINKLMNDLG
jgi:anti-sigma28 factor (negative regulator of flagellin synthesis)